MSDIMDDNRITPKKVLSDSAEEKQLAGGAKDLSGAVKKSNSLPNLTWERIENSMFKQYPTRAEQHVVRRRYSMDGVDCSSWSNKDFSAGNGDERVPFVECSILNRDEPGAERSVINGVGEGRAEQVCLSVCSAQLERSDRVGEVSDRVGSEPMTPAAANDNRHNISPMIKSVKRKINLSPSTPIGLPRKLLFGPVENKIDVITHEEDVEMIDLEHVSVKESKGVHEVKDIITPNRRELKGLRRIKLPDQNTVDVDENLKCSNARFLAAQPGEALGRADASSDGGKNTTTKGNTGASKMNGIKGISIKYLKENSSKMNSLSSRKKPKINYKSTRKKEVKHKVDENQRLINEFLTKTPNN